MTPGTPHTESAGAGRDVHAVPVLGAGVGLPALRLPVAAIASTWAASGASGAKGTVGVCDTDEDPLTLAWQAATDALGAAGVRPQDVSGLWWGTARPPFAEGPNHPYLAASLGLDPACGGALLGGSPHAGMEALLAAWDALAAGHADIALVVASDALLPGLGTPGETATGAGAAALVLGAPGTPAPARLVGRATRAMPAVDRYRADRAAATTDVYDARLFREELFLPLVTEAGGALRDARGARSAPPACWAVSDPDGKLGGAIAKRLGARVASGPVQASLGDTGSAAPLLGLVHACAEVGAAPERGEGVDAAGSNGDATAPWVGVLGYGGGRASAVAVEVSSSLAGSAGLGERLRAGAEVAYTHALRARGQLEAMSEPIQMGLPPAGAAFARGNTELLLLEGARCTSCGTISTPPAVHPACIGCGSGELEIVRLSHQGSVVTFVVNQTMPPPFAAPLPLVVVDLTDGARVMVQASVADAADLAVGDTVTLSLRRYALERGIPVYGYKASRRAAGPAEAGDRPAGDPEEVRT